jgi:hypothetical protein
MKFKDLLFALALCAFIPVQHYAQGVLSPNQIAGPGSSYVLLTEELSSPMFENYDGEDMQWTFDLEGNLDYGNQITYWSPQAFPGLELPGACNLVVQSVQTTDFGNDTLFSLMNLTTDALTLSAYAAADGSIFVAYDSPKLFYPLPLTYGNQYNSTAGYTFQSVFGEGGTDSVRSVVTEETQTLVSGWGTLNINGVPFECLLLRNTLIRSDSSFTYTDGSWSFLSLNSETSYLMQWVDVQSGVVVLEELETEGFKGQAYYQYTFYHSGNLVFPTGMESHTHANAPLVFPNPASDVFGVQCDEEITQMRIFSLDGRLVKQVSGNGASQLQVQTEGFHCGSYLVEVARKGNPPTVSRLIITH